MDAFPTKDIPLERIRTIQSSFLLFYCAISALIFALAGLGGLFFLNRAQEGTREELSAQLRLKEESIRPEVVNEIIALDQRLKDLKTVLSKHVFPSTVFSFIEGITHPQIRFTNFNFDGEKSEILLAGEAPNYITVAQQLTLFEQNSAVEKVDFGGLSIGSKGLISFKAEITMKSSALRTLPQ